MTTLNQGTQQHYLAMKCAFIAVIHNFFFSSNEMKAIANLTGFSLNRHITVETGTEKELRGHNVLVITVFFKIEKLTGILPEGFSCLRDSIKNSSIKWYICQSVQSQN